jgi:hypothetical protein
MPNTPLPSSVYVNLTCTLDLIRAGYQGYFASPQVIKTLEQCKGFLYDHREDLFNIYESMSHFPMRLVDEHRGDIGELIIDRAYEIFDTMGYAKEFCVHAVQFSKGGAVIFGESNRLIFNPKLGYYPDAGHCSPQFLAAYDKHYGTSELELTPLN